MKRIHRITVLFWFAVSVLSGCATLPYSAPLPNDLSIKRIAKVDPSTPFAVGKNGTIAAVSGGSLRLILPGKEEPQDIATLDVTVLSFNPKGDLIAVGTGADGTLHLYNDQGKEIGKTKLRGRITAINWRSDSEILAASTIVRKFSFGSELVTLLHSWDGTSAPTTSTLSDVTIKKSTAAWPDDVIYGTFSMAVSPFGDEIAYRFLRDPPLFTPYQSIMLRHLESGREHELTSIQVGAGGPYFSADGERVVVGDMTGTRWLNLPAGKELDVISAPASNLAASPSGTYLLLNGKLYRGDREIASFAPGSVGHFLPDGSGLVLGYQGVLYIVSGLKDAPPPTPPTDRERLLKLRRLRSLGLITDEEFQKELARGPKR